MQSRIRNDASRTVRICVDSYTQGNPRGCFFNYGQEDEIFEFRSLTQMIVGIEDELDSANFPQSFNAVRSFFDVQREGVKATEESKIRTGSRATFVVKILFRQHTSWQGTITWIGKKVEQPFRSVLELILLMDSALTTEMPRKNALGTTRKISNSDSESGGKNK